MCLLHPRSILSTYVHKASHLQQKVKPGDLSLQFELIGLQIWPDSYFHFSYFVFFYSNYFGIFMIPGSHDPKS